MASIIGGQPNIVIYTGSTPLSFQGAQQEIVGVITPSNVSTIYSVDNNGNLLSYQPQRSFLDGITTCNQNANTISQFVQNGGYWIDALESFTLPNVAPPLGSMPGTGTLKTGINIVVYGGSNRTLASDPILTSSNVAVIYSVSGGSVLKFIPGAGGNTLTTLTSNSGTGVAYWIVALQTFTLPNTLVAGNTKTLISQKDFQYLGAFKFSTGACETDTSFTTGGFTHRYVGGQLRFFAHADDQTLGKVYEMNFPGLGAHGSEPQATTINCWGDCYDGHAWLGSGVSSVNTYATCSATVSGGVIQSITVNSGGAGYAGYNPTYTQVNVCIFDGQGTGATAVATLTPAPVAAISFFSTGSGYPDDAVAVVSGGGGTGAVVTITVSGGAVTSAVLTTPGSGYTTAPLVTVSGGGTGALIIAYLNTSVASVAVTSGGSGYGSSPTIIVEEGSQLVSPTTSWGSIYHLGLHWDETDQRLYSTYQFWYNPGWPYNPTLSACTLDEESIVPTGIGNWRFGNPASNTGVYEKFCCGGMVDIPSWFQTAFGVGRLGIGFGGLFAITSTASQGPSLFAISPPNPSLYPDRSILPGKSLVGFPYSVGLGCDAPPNYNDENPYAGHIFTIDVTSGGSGFTSPPTVTITGGQDVTPPVVTATVSGGAVTGLTLVSGGAGFFSGFPDNGVPQPRVIFTGGGGTGAVADTAPPDQSSCWFNNSGFFWRAPVLTAGGSGYATAPTVSVECQTLATANINEAGQVTSITVNDAGSNYCAYCYNGYTGRPPITVTTDNPIVVTISGGGGTGATAVANVTFESGGQTRSQPVGTVGYWPNSASPAGVWIDTPTKHGVMFFPNMVAGYIYYLLSEPRADWAFEWAFVFDPYDLGQVALGNVNQYDVLPVHTWLVDFPKAYNYQLHINNNAPFGPITGATFDATTNRLYMMFNYAWLPLGQEDYYAMVHAWQLLT